MKAYMPDSFLPAEKPVVLFQGWFNTFPIQKQSIMPFMCGISVFIIIFLLPTWYTPPKLFIDLSEQFFQHKMSLVTLEHSRPQSSAFAHSAPLSLVLLKLTNRLRVFRCAEPPRILSEIFTKACFSAEPT